MAEQRAQRRLAAILAADVVGYSRLVEQDEGGTLTALKARRRDILEPLLAKHQGRIVKSMGDGVLIEFASAVNAVCCAIELQQDMAAANAALPDDRRIVLRIGINLGDVIVDSGDLHGDGVIVAARLEQLAEPGCVYVSGAIFDQVQGKLALDFDCLGDKSLKNITNPVRVFCAKENGAQSGAATRHTTLPAKSSIVVLPFANLSDEPAQDYLSHGITDAIITGLGRFHELFVIAHGSSAFYKGRTNNVREIGRELGVRYVVTGSLRRLGGRIRITAELADSVSGNNLWAEHYDRDLENVMSIQDDVTRTIVATVIGRVRAEDLNRALHKTAENLAAYDLLLHGKHCLDNWTKDEILRSRVFFERAIELDPGYSAAYTELARTYLLEHGSDWTEAPEAAGERAFELARKAVALDESDAGARLVLASAYLRARSDFEMARRQVDTALSFNPNEYWNFCFKGWLTTLEGNSEEGITCTSEAMRLNPFSHDGCLETQFTAAYTAHRYDEAIAAIARMSHPQSWTSAYLAACYAQQGREAEARREMLAYLKAAPSEIASYPGEDREAWRKHWARFFPFKRPADFEHLLDGFRRSGLPV
jgi:TolB-like protein/Flp pilus assembly protein TadD